METAQEEIATRYLTVKEAAAKLGMAYSTINLWCRAKRIKARTFQNGKRQEFRISPNEIERIENRRAQNLPV